mmetsp:Transcript_70918/g.169837  ORF Transcript_70918/g.169837 Transcript_70918/m.169837 type:complete len:177 (-) Transcript_70918:85-615(-)
MPILTGSQCNSIYSTGHSMGGAAAHILAACANRGEMTSLASTAVTSFTVSKVYTFGAPAVSRSALTNPLNSNGCFDGARIYNTDSWTYDPAAAVAQPLGYFHPYVTPLRFYSSDSEQISASVRGNCNSYTATWESMGDLTRTISLGWFGSLELPKAPTITDHSPNTYKSRAKTLYR